MKNIEWIHEIQETKKRQKKPEKISIKEDWLYFLISTQQPSLLNIWLFPAIFCSYVYSISCKFD